MSSASTFRLVGSVECLVVSVVSSLMEAHASVSIIEFGFLLVLWQPASPESCLFSRGGELFVASHTLTSSTKSTLHG